MEEGACPGTSANPQEKGGRCVLQIKGVCTGQAEQVHHTLGRACQRR